MSTIKTIDDLIENLKKLRHNNWTRLSDILYDAESVKFFMENTVTKDRELLIELSAPKLTDEEIEHGRKMLLEAASYDSAARYSQAIYIRKHLKENP